MTEPLQLSLTRRPSAAETARTLAAGVISGALRTWSAGHGAAGATGVATTYDVQQFTDPAGTVALLAGADSPLAVELARDDSPDEPPRLLDVLDIPPGEWCLPRARLCISGWTTVLDAVEQRGLAQQIAITRPCWELLGVGSESVLFRLDIAEIRLTTTTGTVVVPPEDFVQAAPDPLFEHESAVIEHLRDHHLDETIRIALHRLPDHLGRDLSQVSVTGIDRYGIDLQCVVRETHHQLRIGFSGTIADEVELGREMRRILDPDGVRARPTTR